MKIINIAKRIFPGLQIISSKPHDKVYTDGVHLMCRDLELLHKFALNIGLKREWFQHKRKPHYDLTSPRMARKAIRYGAIKVTTRELVRFFKNKHFCGGYTQQELLEVMQRLKDCGYIGGLACGCSVRQLVNAGLAEYREPSGEYGKLTPSGELLLDIK